MSLRDDDLFGSNHYNCDPWDSWAREADDDDHYHHQYRHVDFGVDPSPPRHNNRYPLTEEILPLDLTLGDDFDWSVLGGKDTAFTRSRSPDLLFTDTFFKEEPGLLSNNTEYPLDILEDFPMFPAADPFSLAPGQPLQTNVNPAQRAVSRPSSSDESSRQPRAVKPQKAATVDTTAKIASRVYALYRLFSARLPERRAAWLTDAQHRALRNRRTLVKVLEFGQGRLVISFPVDFDIIVHSQANYGMGLTESAALQQTRFRWWSDFQIEDLNGNRIYVEQRCDNNEIIRTVHLPAELVNHPHLQRLFKRKDQQGLLAHIADFFEHLLDGYLVREDRRSFSQSGFGRTRRHPLPSPMQRPLQTVLERTLDFLDAK
jgi:hypothetical protein